MQQNEKNYFAYTKPAFLWILRSPQLLGFHTFLAVLCSQQRFKFFQELFRIWILQGWSTAPHEHILSQGWVQSGMPTLSALQKHVSWQEIVQRLPGPVQRLGTGNVGDAWKTTWDLTWNCSLDETHFTPGKFTWTWIHAPTDSHSVASTVLHAQVHMNVNACPNRQPQHSIYFMCKSTWTCHGRLRAVVQLG